MNPGQEERCAGPFWRVFPWNPTAADGAPFSPRFNLPPGTQSGGRFDLLNVPILYLAETPEHAVSEVLRRFEGASFFDENLLIPDRATPHTYYRRAIVRAWVPERITLSLPDLCEGATLHRLGIRADTLASADRATTQEIARTLHAQGVPGFRWWSALRGDWHVTVLFLDRVDVRLVRYDEPEPLTIDHPTVREAARILRIRLL